jgi:DNA-binding transcriptional LysR family regulator
MDRLRAIEYFNRAVEQGSFAAAARSCDVTTAAVTQLISALEQSLGVRLFHRSRHGLALTAEGERYYETSSRVAQLMREVELTLQPRGAKPRGRLVVGLRPQVGQCSVAPHIARFLARYPDIELVLKTITTIKALDEGVDIAVLIGWPSDGEAVVRILAQTELIVCASPQYWDRAGMPQDPEDLRNHHCMVLRSAGGMLLDRWIFEKGGERRVIDVRARIFSDDGGMLHQAACGDAGVVRLVDLVLRSYLSTGLLVRALEDWKALEAPLLFAAYPKRQRQSKLVRAFIEFLQEIFAPPDEQGRTVRGVFPPIRPPEWVGHTRGRQSAYAPRRRSTRA